MTENENKRNNTAIDFKNELSPLMQLCQKRLYVKLIVVFFFFSVIIKLCACSFFSLSIILFTDTHSSFGVLCNYRVVLCGAFVVLFRKKEEKEKKR